jgi:hypothetical protein
MKNVRGLSLWVIFIEVRHHTRLHPDHYSLLIEITVDVVAPNLFCAHDRHN